MGSPFHFCARFGQVEPGFGSPDCTQCFSLSGQRCSTQLRHPPISSTALCQNIRFLLQMQQPPAARPQIHQLHRCMRWGSADRMSMSTCTIMALQAGKDQHVDARKSRAPHLELGPGSLRIPVPNRNSSKPPATIHRVVGHHMTHIWVLWTRRIWVISQKPIEWNWQGSRNQQIEKHKYKGRFTYICIYRTCSYMCT